MDHTKYKNTFYYPTRADYHTYNVFDKENKCVLPNVTLSELKVWFKINISASEQDTEANMKKVLFDLGYAIGRIDNTKKYEEQKALYFKEQNRVDAQFKKDLLEEHNATNLKKVNELYDKAWEYGHDSGYREVDYHFYNLLPLIKE
jgi:hypothetical protein